MLLQEELWSGTVRCCLQCRRYRPDRSNCVHGNCIVLSQNCRIVLGDDTVLLVNVPVVRIYRTVCAVNIVIISEVHCRECHIGDSCSNSDTERRTANDVMSVVRSVIHIVIDVVVHAEISRYPVSRRQDLNPETEAMRVMMVVEMSRTVVRHKSAVTWRDTFHIVVVDPEVISIVHSRTRTSA